MFCSRCGSEITGKSKFCPSCGLDLMATTPVHAIATGALQETDLVREALAAEYEIIEELGRGGMALVYRARDRQLEREVAIKVLPFSLAFDAEFVERFQREARTAAQLEHPNIIPIYRVGRSGRVIYFVMKYLRGGSLSTVLQERKKLTPPEIRRLLLEAGSALGYAAQRGIVHRDIKPDNIMFDEFGQCLLTDFGIAKAASGQKLTGTGMSIGTPHYMSPEQARAQAIDGRSDIYSLGVVAYQCLSGDGALRRRGQLLDRLQAHHRADPHALADHRRRAADLRGHQAHADEGSGGPLPELRGAGRVDPGPAHRGARRGAGLGRGGRAGGRTVEHADGGQPERRRPADREPADHADRFAAGQPARHAARAAGPAAAGRRPIPCHARGPGLLLGLALGGAGRAGRRRGRFYYYKSRGFAPGIGADADSAASAADTTPFRDTTAAGRPRRKATVRRRRPRRRRSSRPRRPARPSRRALRTARHDARTGDAGTAVASGSWGCRAAPRS